MMTTAKLRHLRISPRKVRLVAGLVRGLDVLEAEKQLRALTKRASAPILKLLSSAVANASKNHGLAKENLYISEIKVDDGPSLKRWRARAMGRAAAILKRTSHVALTLAEKDLSVVKPVEKKFPKQKEATALVDLEKERKERPTAEVVERIEAKDQRLPREKSIAPKRPYREDSQSKKRFFSRQTFGNAKKVFRRKSI